MDITDTKKDNKREYGVDLLRIISMFMVTVLHVLGRGGGLSYASNNLSYETAYILEIAAFCAVNVYALISGYVGVNSKFKISRIIYIYVEVMFYTIFLFLVYKGNHPELVTEDCIKKTFLPIFNSHYWYISAYVGLFFFTPLLNYGIKNVPRNVIRPTLYIMIILFTILPYVFNVTQFSIGYGYSMPWLMVLYIFGAYIKVYNPFDRFKKQDCILVYILSILITFVLHKFKIPGFLNYNSITIFIEGIALLVLFSKIDIKTNVMKKVISLVAKLTLGVYIIHVNWFIWRVQVNDFSVDVAKTGSIIVVIYRTLKYALKIFIPCIILDLLRYYLFELIRFRKLLSYLDKLFEIKPKNANKDFESN